MCGSCDGKFNPRDHGIVEILDRNYGIEKNPIGFGLNSELKTLPCI